MARPTSKYPTELELAILKILWENGQATVRQVRDALSPERDLAYTSVMTIMNIMVEKGYSERNKTGASFVYKAKVSQKDTTRGMLNDLVERVFDGSAAAVMVNLIESEEFNQDEIKKLREMIDHRCGEK